MLNLKTHMPVLHMSSTRRIYFLVFLLLATLCIVIQLLVFCVFSVWDRNRVENTLSASFHRQVHLGQINWRMGFRGLAFDTEEIGIQDKDNTPFFHANKTTILFGIIPLLRGQLRIKHLDMQQPQAWAKRLAENTWNFSDLPQSDTFSKFADCKVIDGSLQLIDKRLSDSNPYVTELKHIQFETRHQFGKYYWPFALNAQMSQPEGICSISLTGNGRGSFNELQKCNYSFTLNAYHFAPMRLLAFLDSPVQTEGLIDLEVEGSGVPTDEFNGNANIKIDHLNIKPKVLEPLKISQATIQTQILLNKKQIVWKDLSIKIGDSELKSTGNVSQWLSATPSYQATLECNTEELERVLNNVNAKWIASQLSDVPRDFALAGKIDLSGSVQGIYPNQSFISSMILHNVRAELKKRNFVLNAIEGSIKSDHEGLHIRQVKASLHQGSLAADAEMAPNEQTSIKIKGSAIAIEDIKAMSAIANIHSQLDSLNIHGNIQTVNIAISGSADKYKVSLTTNPAGIFLTTQDHNQLLKINSGLITCDDNALNLSKLSGTLGNGTFTVDGHVGLVVKAPSDITISAQNLDLTDAKILTQSLGLQNKSDLSLLFEGKIRDLKIHLFDTKQTRQITMSILPENLLYEPADALGAVHLVGGSINYDNAVLTLANVSMKGKAIQCIANAKVSHCDGEAQLDTLKIDDAVIDLKEASTCWLGGKNPQSFRQSFIKLLEVYGISAIEGKVTGHLFVKNGINDSRLVMNCALEAVHFKRSGQTVSVNGTISTDRNNNLNLQALTCSVNNSKFTLDGRLGDLSSIDDVQSQLKIEGQIYYQDLISFFPSAPMIFQTNEPIKILAYISKHDNSLVMKTSRIVIGQLPFQTAGTINGISDKIPTVDIKAWIHEPIAIQTILNSINQGKPDSNWGQIIGTLRGGMHIVGPINNPTVTAGCKIFDAGQLKLAVTNINGHLKMTLVPDSKNNNIKNPVITFNLDTISLARLPFKLVSGSVTYFSTGPQTSIGVDNMKANIATGTLTGSAELQLNEQLPFHTDIQLAGLDANELTKQLGGKQNELNGKADILISLDGNAKSWQELIKSLSGSGSFQATNGHIDKLRQLQVKLEEANLLEQGVVGFRVSNVLGIVEPHENGEFISANGKLNIDKGVVQLQNIVFNGQELKLQSGGTLDLDTKRIVLHTNGDIAHIGEEGSLGKVASMASVASLADVVTKELHPKTPHSFSSHPFVFDVNGYLDQPNTIDTSIAKSFHWTANFNQTKTQSTKTP